MATPYKVLFDGVVSKLRSTGISNITEDEFDEILLDYIRPACVRFRACKQNLSKRNDTLAMFEIELIDEEIEILINFIYIEFLSANYINVPSLLRQSLVSREMAIPLMELSKVIWQVDYIIIRNRVTNDGSFKQSVK